MYLHIYTPKVCEVFFLDAWHEIHGCIHIFFAWFHRFSYFQHSEKTGPQTSAQTLADYCPKDISGLWSSIVHFYQG